MVSATKSASSTSSVCPEKPTQEEQARRQFPEVTQRLGQSPVLRAPNPKPRTKKAEARPAFSPAPALRVWELGGQLGFHRNQPWGQGRGQPRAIEISAPTPLDVRLFCVD